MFCRGPQRKPQNAIVEGGAPTMVPLNLGNSQGTFHAPSREGTFTTANASTGAATEFALPPGAIMDYPCG